MITILDFTFWFNFVYFVLAVFVAFFIPGDILVGKSKMPILQRITLGIIIGMVLWAWQGFIFGYLNFRFLTYIYILIFTIIWFSKNRLTLKFQVSTFSKILKRIDIVILSIFVLGVFVQLTPLWGFGLKYSDGIFLCCGNRQDALYHVALTQSIVNSFPPVDPGMAGTIVKNYHYWSNIVVAELVRVFKLPIFYTQFQFTTIFISLFLGLAIISLSKIIKLSRVFTSFLLIFSFLGGDFMYLLVLLFGKGITAIRDLSSLEDGSTFLVNPPRAFSIVIAYIGFCLLYIWTKDKNRKFGLISVFLLASTVGFKVYTGIFAGLGIVSLIIYFLFSKKNKDALIALTFFPIAAIIYFSNNADAGGLFFAPFQLANDFIVQPSLGLVRLELARQVFLQHNNFLRVLEYELIFSAIFLFGVLGTKSIAFFQSPRSIKSLGKPLSIFVITGIIGSLILGTFFLQKSGGANIFNFIVSAWVFMSIFSAAAIDYWAQIFKNKLKIVFITIVLLLTVPRVLLNTYYTVSEYLRLQYQMIPNSELESYKFITQNTSRNALFLVDSDYQFEINTPQLSAFVNRPMFLSGKQILESHGINVEDREKIKETILKSQNVREVKNLLYINRIQYIYLKKTSNLSVPLKLIYTKIVFQNDKVKILKVN